jgi:hypothetical protein
VAEVLSVSAEWKPRREEPYELAVRLKQMLDRLSSVHPSLQHWLKLSKSPRISQLPFCKEPTDLAELSSLIEKGQYFKKAKKKKIDLGFRVQAWRDRGNGKHSGLIVWAGNGDSDGSTFPNWAQLSIVVGGTAEEKALARALIPAWRYMIQAWEPDRGNAYSYMFGTRSRGPGDPFPYLCGCWAAYVAKAQMCEVVLPPDALVQGMPDRGSLIMATAEAFDVMNPAHLRVARAIQETIEPVWSIPRFG